MKKLLLFTASVVMISFISPVDTLSKKERKYATKFLKDTENGVLDAAKGLSEAQLKFKPAADRWSIEDCLKHIAASETAIWQMIEGTVKQPANPDLRSEIKTTDEQLIQMIEDRSHKVQTQEPLKPENTPFKSVSEALESFKTNRAKLIQYVKSTNEDLRNHVATLPIGKFDSYQMILFLGGHSKRHTLQIDEIKADPNFPKS